MKAQAFSTVNDIRDEKRLGKRAIEALLRQHPQVGVFSNGKFYAFVKGGYVESPSLSRVIAAISEYR